MPNKLSQFWQELKRRNVVRVITVYAGAAFVILELVDMSSEPFGLPGWTFLMVAVLLSVGFLIAVILSWIYDIHPEGGMVKTEPANKVKAEDIPKSSNGWKIASYISFVVIVGLIVLNIISRSDRKEILDKSIAVLPFQNDSPNQEMYFINGVMEEILDNLCKIEDLRVVSRSSVEQYRDNPKPIPVVADEMNVSYVLEGSGQRDGANIRLTVQLLDARRDQHIWSESYYREIKNIFELQSEIAQSIAAELQVVIKPAEKGLMNKIPTTSLTALDYYQEARENYWEYELHRDTMALNRAEALYKKVLENDPTYSQAYNGLAMVYRKKHGSEEYLTDSYLDSVLILTNMSLSHNHDISETHVIRGDYYGARDNFEQAIIEYDKALQLNPNEWMAYWGKANLYQNIDNLLQIENLHKAISLNRGQRLSFLLEQLSLAYSSSGFSGLGLKYAQQYLDLTGDSIIYLDAFLGGVSLDNQQQRIEVRKKIYALDSSDLWYTFQLADEYSWNGYYEEGLKYFKKFLSMGGFYNHGIQRIGYAFWKNGFEKEANYYFDLQIEYSMGEIERGRRWTASLYPYYDMAGVYAFRGEKEKALECLRIFSTKEMIPYWTAGMIQYDPLLDNIRDEPEFKQIFKDIEVKTQAEHERVRQWLEENEML